MSSVQDRIRKLQSLDSGAAPAAPRAGAVASAKERLSTQASLPASLPSLARPFAQGADGADAAAPTAASVSALARAVEATALAPAAPRVGQVAADLAARDAAAARPLGGAHAAASIIHRLESQADGDDVRDRVRRMEREKPGALAKGAMPAGALDGRRAAFERDKAEATALVRGKVAAFAGDEEPPKAPARGGRDKAVEKARGGEEDQSAKGDRRDEETGDEEAAVKKPVGLGQRFAMFEGGTAAAENGAAHVKVKAKVDEGDRPVAKAVAKAVGKVPAASGDGGTVKGKTSTGEAGVVQELREVKKQNEELLKRLVELTTAFKRLEKNREALQGRLAKLEKK